MANVQKYSLWLRPFGDAAFSLKRRIRDLSAKYGSPSFEPHVTLLGGLTGSEAVLRQLTSSLAASLHPFDIVLTSAGYEDSYFKSLYIHVQKSRELMNARTRAEQLFGHNADERYHPHLSLMYGNFPQEEKERILNRMGREFHLRFSVQNIMLIPTGGNPDKWIKIHSAELKE